MAVDEAILRAVARGCSPATLRLYAWRPSCLSLGRGQPSESVDWEACAAAGVAWVRRPTGGRAILHGNDLTYSICLALEDPRASGDILASYRRLSEGLVEGLRLLGVPAVQAAVGGDEGEPSAACFDALAGYEIAVGGKKLLGSAQFRSEGALLQHGALPLFGDVGAVVDYLALPREERMDLRTRLARTAVTLETAAGRRVGFDEAASALRHGIERALNVHLERGRLTAEERREAEELAEGKYANLEWRRGRQRLVRPVLR